MKHSYFPISLSEMEGVKLMNRIDKKYIVPIGAIPYILENASNDYRMLEIDGVRSFTYDTIYFDTQSLELYHQHQAGRSNRYKVRHRLYKESEKAFFEIKHKNNKLRTDKIRKPTITSTDQNIVKEDKIYLENTTPLAADNLRPSIKSIYQRITLVSNLAIERVTIDLNLTFEKHDQSTSYRNLAIIEIKQAQNSKSAISQIIKQLGYRPGGISKYCLGVVSLIPNIKHNRFKQTINKIKKLIAQNDTISRSN
jgi:hypothetical protein